MANTLVKTRIISTSIHRHPPEVGAYLQMTGALEEHVTSYDKHAHVCITAIDTRLMDPSYAKKRKKKTICHVFVFYTSISPHEDNMRVDCILKTH